MVINRNYTKTCIKKNRFLTILLVCLHFLNFAYSQPVNINLNFETSLRFEKLQFNKAEFHSNIKPFRITDKQMYDSILLQSEIKVNNRFLYKLLNSNILEINKNKSNFYINPILTIAPEFSSNSNQNINNYKAGISVGGNFGKKLGYQINWFYGYQSFYDRQNSRIDSAGIVPGYGEFIKKTGKNYQFAPITGYLSYSPWKYLNLQAGIDGNFWGDGYRSLFLSDNSSKYPFFKASVDIWKLKYIWLFGYLRDFNNDLFDEGLKSKLLFSHYLSWNATKWLNFNFFESIVSSPVDSVGVTYFNVSYLNPVIFYRPVEFAGGSADNAILGFGFKFKIFEKYQFYSQVVIDEFIWSQMKSGNGWWGNKFGIQGGVKIFDAIGVKNLYLQIEYNALRPYTYSYSNSILNYGNHFQPLAHPSGANSEELIAIAHYNKQRFSVMLKSVINHTGLDTDSISFGQDIYKPYTARKSDYNNSFKQGYPGYFYHFEAQFCWMINPKMNQMLYLRIYKQKCDNFIYKFNQNYISLGIKCLLYRDDLDYL